MKLHYLTINHWNSTGAGDTCTCSTMLCWEVLLPILTAGALCRALSASITVAGTWLWGGMFIILGVSSLWCPIAFWDAGKDLVECASKCWCDSILVLSCTSIGTTTSIECVLECVVPCMYVCSHWVSGIVTLEHACWLTVCCTLANLRLWFLMVHNCLCIAGNAAICGSPVVGVYG